jgi:hypothetical protein
MSLDFRPVTEVWGEVESCSLQRDEFMDLMEEIALRAQIRSQRHQYADVTVIWVDDGQKFIDLIAGGREALLDAKQEGNYDLYPSELEYIDKLSGNMAAWRPVIDRTDGSLRLYID